jgi:DNA-binding MarR family transcriptional regulator
MFVKETTVRRAERLYTYLQLVEGYRDAGGRVRHRVVANLGRKEALKESGQLDALAGSFARLDPPMLGAHGALTREMNAHLVAAHGLTLTDYEVLLRLSSAPEVGLTRSDLAHSTLLTQGGITRLLGGLERAGLVESASGETDRRIYARLTEAGQERFREAARTHVHDIATMFTERFSSDELATLAELLGRLPGKPEQTDSRRDRTR